MSQTRQRQHGESALTREDREAACAVAYEEGLRHQFGIEVEEAALAMLNRDARRMSDWARRLAAVKGSSWEAMIVWSGEADD